MSKCALQLQEDRRVGAREHLGSPWSAAVTKSSFFKGLIYKKVKLS